MTTYRGAYTGARLHECDECAARGNVSQDSDGAWRCRPCSFAAFRARDTTPPRGIYDLPIFGWAWVNDARDLRA